MGWGTFVAGRVLGPRRRRPITKRDIETAEMLNRKINSIVGPNKKVLETEVLREIKRLKANGEEVDIDALREVVRNRFKTYDRLGPKLELEIIRISQIKALAGEEVNYGEIEREILDRPKKSSARKFTLPKDINSLGLYEDDSLPSEKAQSEGSTKDAMLGLFALVLGALVIGLLLY